MTKRTDRPARERTPKVADLSPICRRSLDTDRPAQEPEEGPTLGERTAGLIGSVASKSAPAGRAARQALGKVR
jgi:hypothetical protein